MLRANGLAASPSKKMGNLIYVFAATYTHAPSSMHERECQLGRDHEESALHWYGWERGLGVSINTAACLAHLVAGAREELNARTNTQSVGNQRSP